MQNLKDSATSVVVTTSWDDGHVLDSKLATLLSKYGIAATFYISPENHELGREQRLTREQVANLAEEFEIGAHTMTHPFLPDCDEMKSRGEIFDSKKVLEEWTGKPVTSFCYPRGGYTERDKKLVKIAGFTYARTVRRFALSCGADHFAVPTTIHAYDHWSDVSAVIRLAHFNPIPCWTMYHNWERQAIALFDTALAHGGVFHLWGHSWEIERRGDWTRLERVLAHISKRGGVQYVQNKDLV